MANSIDTSDDNDDDDVGDNDDKDEILVRQKDNTGAQNLVIYRGPVVSHWRRHWRQRQWKVKRQIKANNCGDTGGSGNGR